MRDSLELKKQKLTLIKIKNIPNKLKEMVLIKIRRMKSETKKFLIWPIALLVLSSFVMAEVIIQIENNEEATTGERIVPTENVGDDYLEECFVIEIDGKQVEKCELSKIEEDTSLEDVASFDPTKSYTLETFPTYGGEDTEHFLERFRNYFGREFNLEEWQEMLEKKKKIAVDVVATNNTECGRYYSYEFHESKDYSLVDERDISSNHSIIKQTYADVNDNYYYVYIHEFPDFASLSDFIVKDIYENKKSYSEMKELYIQLPKHVYRFEVLILNNDCKKIITGSNKTLLVFEADTKYPSKLLETISQKYPTISGSTTESFRMLIKKVVVEGMKSEFISSGLLPPYIEGYELIRVKAYQPENSFPIIYIAYYPDFEVRITDFSNKSYSEYLDGVISSEIDTNNKFVFEGAIIFHHIEESGYSSLVWLSGKKYVKIRLRPSVTEPQIELTMEEESKIEKESILDNLPINLIKAFLEKYPSNCDENGCYDMNKSIEEIYKKFFLGYNQYTNGLFFKHKGFSIRCRNIIKYGREGAKEYPDLDYNQFKERVNRSLSDSMYFSEDELKRLYDKCIEEGEIEIEGLPLSGFLKDCYDRVSPILRKDEEHKIDETSLKLCDNINLIIIENNEYFNKLKEGRGSEIINQIIDFIVQKKLEKIEHHEQYCKDVREGRIKLEGEEVVDCGIDIELPQICYEQEDGRVICEEEEGDEESVVRLKPCTEEDLEKGLDCTPIRKVDDKKSIEEETTEEYKERQEQSIFVKIISFFKKLFS